MDFCMAVFQFATIDQRFLNKSAKNTTTTSASQNTHDIPMIGRAKMPRTLDASSVESLISFVDRHVRSDGCDHTHRFTQEWARQESVNWHDLLDILEANGGYCDCEVVLNLPDGTDLQSPPAAKPAERTNPWLLPPTFECEPSAVFTKVIVCQATLGRNTYA